MQILEVLCVKKTQNLACELTLRKWSLSYASHISSCVTSVAVLELEVDKMSSSAQSWFSFCGTEAKNSDPSYKKEVEEKEKTEEEVKPKDNSKEVAHTSRVLKVVSQTYYKKAFSLSCKGK